MVSRLLGVAALVFIRLVEEEVGRELLILVAGKVSLDRLIAVETKAAQPFDSIALLLGDSNGLGSGGKGRVVVPAALSEEAQELLGILGDQLGQLGVTRAELLKDGLEHLRLLLDYLAQLLELGVGSKEVKVAEILLGGCRSSSCFGGGGGGGTSTGCTSTRARASVLSGQVKEVDVAIVVEDRCGRLSASWRGGLTGGLLLEVLRNALDKECQRIQSGLILFFSLF